MKSVFPSSMLNTWRPATSRCNPRASVSTSGNSGISTYLLIPQCSAGLLSQPSSLRSLCSLLRVLCVKSDSFLCSSNLTYSDNSGRPDDPVSPQDSSSAPLASPAPPSPVAHRAPPPPTPDHFPPQYPAQSPDSPLPTPHAIHKSPPAEKSPPLHPSAADNCISPPARPTSAFPPAAPPRPDGTSTAAHRRPTPTFR